MVVVAVILGWILVSLTMGILCVAARRGDESEKLRRADAALPHLPTRLSA